MESRRDANDWSKPLTQFSGFNQSFLKIELASVTLKPKKVTKESRPITRDYYLHSEGKTAFLSVLGSRPDHPQHFDGRELRHP